MHHVSQAGAIQKERIQKERRKEIKNTVQTGAQADRVVRFKLSSSRRQLVNSALYENGFIIAAHKEREGRGGGASRKRFIAEGNQSAQRVPTPLGRVSPAKRRPPAGQVDGQQQPTS